MLSTNAINAYSDWSNSTNYAAGDRVTYGNFYWESLIDSNVNQDPESTTLKWSNLGASSRWAMFDTRVASQTECTGALTISVQPMQVFTSFSMFNVSAKSVHVQVLDRPGGIEVYSKTKSMDNTQIASWFTYFLEEFDLGDEVTFDDIPMYKQAVINITATPITGLSAKIGAFVVGSVFDIGMTQYGSSYGIRDYSRKETDEFGVATFVERNFSKRMQVQLMVNNGQLNFLSKLFVQMRARPTSWRATSDDRFQGMTIFGYCKDWNVEVEYPNHSLVSLEIEGLT